MPEIILEDVYIH